MSRTDRRRAGRKARPGIRRRLETRELDAASFDPSALGSVAPTLPGGGRLVPGKRYLSVRVKPARAFVENILDDAEARAGGFHVLRLSAEFRGARCVSAPVPATVEPQFNENFLFALQSEERELEGLAPLDQLAERLRE